MFRKLTLALIATAAIGATSIAVTTPASAHWHGGWGGWHGHFWGGPRIFVGGPRYIVADPCLRQRLVPTPWGYRYRTVNVCY